MPENSVKIILEATNKTSEAFNSLKGDAEGLFSSLKQNWLGFTAAAASIYGVISSLQSFVDEASKAEQVESRMAFQIESLGVKYKDIKVGIDAFADSIQKTTRFSDESAREGLGKMLQYTGDLNKAMQATQLAMDMTTQTGMDLDTMIRYIGMAINGDIEIMGRWIVEFRDLDARLGENATKAQKAEFAWKIFLEKFGGASVADLKTHAGQVAKATNQWVEFERTLGDLVMPVVDKGLEKLTALGKATLLSLGKGNEKDVLNAQINRLQAELLALQVEQPVVSGKAQLEILAKIEEAKKRIVEVDKAEAAAEAKIKEESDKRKADLDKVKPPEADWIKKWVAQFDELKYSFEQLGVVSQASLAKVAQSADTYLGVIDAAFQKGKATAMDYKNALAAATDAMQKLVPPDTTQQVTDLWMAYDQGVKQIAEDDPNRGAKISALIDQVMKQIKAIEGPTINELKAAYAQLKPAAEKAIKESQEWIDENPIKAALNTKAFATLDEAFNSLKQKIETTPIKLNVDSSALGGGSSGSSGLYASNMGMVSGAFADQNYDVKLKFWGEASPRKPLSETIQDIISQFGGIQEAMSGMTAIINFSEMSIQMQGLQRQLDQVANITQAYRHVNEAFPHVSSIGNGPWLDPSVAMQLEQMKSDIMSQMGLTQMKMIMEMLQGFGQGEYATGTSFVPKTGWYKLHRGEEVRTANQVSMSSGPFVFNISGNDPKAIANEIEKTLKYGLSQGLRDEIKKIR